MQKLLLTLGFLATLVPASAMISTPAMAACSPGWCNGEVNDFYAHAGGVFLRTTGDESVLNCTQVQGIYIYLKKTHANYEALVALLLMAHQAHQPVFIRIVEGSPDCEVTYVRSQY